MKITLAFVPVALLLAGCATDAMWSEAPGTARYGGYYGSGYAPVGWWGGDAPGLDAFYGPLSAYGRWVQYPAYGMVFLPSGLASGWMPYSNGYWAGNGTARNWVSSEPFGWATYHYGRWADDPRLGWLWVPDTRFSTAWVDWRETGGRASWAPLSPAGWQGRAETDRRWLSAPSAYLGRTDLRRHIEYGRSSAGPAGDRQPARAERTTPLRRTTSRPAATRPATSRPIATRSGDSTQGRVHAHPQADNQTVRTRPAERPADRQTGRQTGRQMGRQTIAPDVPSAATSSATPTPVRGNRAARTSDNRAERPERPERVRQDNRQRNHPDSRPSDEARQQMRTQPQAGQRSWQARGPRSAPSSAPHSSAPSTTGRRR